MFATRLRKEAERIIFQDVGIEGWQKLSQSDKALLCAGVVQALLDKKRVQEFLDGGRKTLN